MITAQDAKIAVIDAFNVGFPTSGHLDVSEAVNPDSDHFAAAVSGRLDARTIEHANHLQERFLDPVAIDGGRRRVPSRPGMAPRCSRDAAPICVRAGAERGHREGVVA
jgi:hypothetical protein